MRVRHDWAAEREQPAGRVRAAGLSPGFSKPQLPERAAPLTEATDASKTQFSLVTLSARCAFLARLDVTCGGRRCRRAAYLRLITGRYFCAEWRRWR